MNSNVKVEAIAQKHNGSNKRQNSKHRSQSKGKSNNKGSCHNCGMNHPLRNALHMVKLATLVIKKAILSCSADPDREARVRENGSQGSPDMISMRLKVQTTEIKTMTPVGFSLNRIQYRCCLVKVFVQTNSMSNIQFDEIDGKGIHHVLTYLTLIKANGPKCSYASMNSVEYTHYFKADSGASGNLLPLCLYRKIFPNVTQCELERSIDHRVQLLAYNKKVIKELGVCYLHVKNSQGHTKLCKFFIVNSKFNPIIGVNYALRLGLICFKTPI